MHSDEAKLVDLVCKGDQRAYTELVMRHLSSIEVYAKRIVSDEALAQDIAQEVMTVLWQRSSEFNPAKARLTTWLHRIAHNRCVDVLRKRKREVSLDSDEPQREASAPAPSALGQSSIDAELRRLPESQRTALVLTLLDSTPLTCSQDPVELIAGTTAPPPSSTRISLGS